MVVRHLPSPGQNAPGGDLHANFRLALAGEQLGLFAPDGTLVDGLSFGPQTNDVSLGRYPDGAELPLYEMAQPTPRGPNSLAGANRPPVFEPVPDQTIAEVNLLTFTVKATDPDDGQTVHYSLGPDAPIEATIDEHSGLFRWTPSEADGPARLSFLFRATDDGTPVRVGTVRVNVQVTESNQPPRLDPVADQVVDEGTLLALQFTAEDPDFPPNRLVFTLAPGAPEDALLTEDGAFTWTPNESSGGTGVTLTIRVSDLGSPEYTDSVSFQITVREVPNPPDMPFIPAQFVDEGNLLSLQIEAADPDTPPSPLIFTLESGPPGATLAPFTGQLTWLPGEAVGPTNAIFVVRATELNPPSMSSARTFSVTVNEVNQAPTLFPIADQALREGQTLAVQAAAFDADLPPQRLTFSLTADAPPEMSIDPATGWLLWSVGADAGSSTNDVIVRVTDDGPPPRGAQQTFRVVVRPQPHLVINEIMYRPKTNLTEFVEVLNNSARAAIDLGGVELTAANLAFTFPAGTTLAPGDFRLVVRNRTAFEAAYGTGLPIAGQWIGNLS